MDQKPVSKQEFRDAYRTRMNDLGFDQLSPSVPITLKGKEFLLEFNNYSVKMVMSRLGLNLLVENPDPRKMGDPDYIGTLLHCALLTNHPEVTQDEVDKLYGLKVMLYVEQKLEESMTLFRPDVSDLKIVEAITGSAEAVEELHYTDPTEGPIGSGSDTGRSEDTVGSEKKISGNRRQPTY